jgi:hypothetical protein
MKMIYNVVAQFGLIVIFGFLSLIIWESKSKAEKPEKPEKPEKLEPWTIVCDHQGTWSYTDEYGEIATDNLKSRKDAEDRMSYWKRWTDEFNARDHAAERAAREKIRADRAKQFTVCNDTAAIKDETGAGKLVKLGDLPSDVKTVEVDGLITSAVGTIPNDWKGPSDLVISEATLTAPASISFAGITIDLHTGEVKGTENLSEASQEFWKAVTTAFPDFKRSIIEGK